MPHASSSARAGISEPSDCSTQVRAGDRAPLELLTLDHDAIDYRALPDQTLRALALEVEPFIATSALTELAIRRSAAAADVAWTILTRSEEDRHLRALALEDLFTFEPDRAVAYMNGTRLADPDLRQAMVELVAEHPDVFSHEPGAAFTRELARRGQESSLPGSASRRDAVVVARRRSS